MIKVRIRITVVASSGSQEDVRGGKSVGMSHIRRWQDAEAEIERTIDGGRRTAPRHSDDR